MCYDTMSATKYDPHTCVRNVYINLIETSVLRTETSFRERSIAADKSHGKQYTGYTVVHERGTLPHKMCGPRYGDGEDSGGAFVCAT